MAKRPGLYANIHAKRRRIKAGSGEKRCASQKSKGAPSAKAFKQSALTAKKETYQEKEKVMLTKRKRNVNLSVGRGEKLPASKGIRVNGHKSTTLQQRFKLKRLPQTPKTKKGKSQKKKFLCTFTRLDG